MGYVDAGVVLCAGEEEEQVVGLGVLGCVIVGNFDLLEEVSLVADDNYH